MEKDIITVYLQVNENRIYGYSLTKMENDNESDVGESPFRFVKYQMTKDQLRELDELLPNVLLVGGKIQKMDEEEIKREKEKEEKETTLETLRKERNYLFRTYIDRSPMFYKRLTDEELRQVEAWYQTWLDMPESFENGTWEEPEIPHCLL